MRRSTAVIAGAVAAVAVFGGGYAIGANYAPKPEATVAAANPTGSGIPRGAGAQGSGAPGGRAATGLGPMSGKVIAVNADSITIEPVARSGANGSPAAAPTIVLVGTGTRLVATNAQDGKLTELKAGDQVTIVGSSDSTTGVISAQAVVIGGTDLIGQLFGGGATWPGDPSQRPGAVPISPAQPAADGGHGGIPGLPGIPGFGGGGFAGH